MELDIIIDHIEETKDYWDAEPANDDTLIDYMTLEEWLACNEAERAYLVADDIDLVEYYHSLY